MRGLPARRVTIAHESLSEEASDSGAYSFI